MSASKRPKIGDLVQPALDHSHMRDGHIGIVIEHVSPYACMVMWPCTGPIPWEDDAFSMWYYTGLRRVE